MKRKLIVISLLVICCLTLVGCTKEEKKERTIDDIIKGNNYIVVDVRTKEEYEEGHVVDSINIPYDEIDKNTKLDKKKTILVYCKSGVRSGKAYDTLKSLGYDVVDLGAYANVTLEKE